MTSSEQYKVAASQLRAATDKAAELWKQGTLALTEQAEQLARMPTVDPAAGVDRYFELLQQAVDVNRELAGKWAGAVASMSEVFGRQVAGIGEIAQRQADAMSQVMTAQDDSTGQAATAAAQPAPETPPEAAQAVQDTLAKIRQDATPGVRRAGAGRRTAAKQPDEKAREPYLGLTKAALAAKLVERSLPKSGTLAELIDRLVASDRSS